MKVYFIENENPNWTYTGGIMSYLINLSNLLQKQNIETTLCGTGKNECNIENTLFSKFLSVTESENPSNFNYIMSLFLKIKFFNIDESAIIHSQRPDMLIPAIFFGKRNRLVCTLHGAHDIAVFDKKGTLYGTIYSFLQKIAFNKAHKLIAVDVSTRNYYVKKYPWVEKKIEVIPIAIDCNKFKPMNKQFVREKYGFQSEEKIVICIGRLEKEKNLPMLLNVFVEVSHQIMNSKLIIVGKGSKEQQLLNISNRLNMKNVVFWGELENEKIPELLNCSDVFAFCSLYEGSPTVIKEALACNLPVVSVDVGDVKEVIEGIDGCYIAERDVKDFSLKILNVLGESKSINSRAKILKSSYEIMGKKTLDLYDSLLKR